MAPNLRLHLHELELALRRHAFLELSIADAVKLRKAFLFFKERLLAGLFPQEPGALSKYLSLETVDDLATQASEILQAAEAERNVKSARVGKKKQILLAEHDPKVAAFFIKHLQKAGYEVFWSSYSLMAKTLLQNADPAVILCSVYSSRSFGREVLTYVRNRGDEHIPVIVIGGADHSEALRDAIMLGADDYMAQHITAAEVIGKVERLLN